MQSLLKKSGSHLAAIGVFLLLTITYFSPAVLDGKRIRQGDMEKVSGMGHSQMEQYEKTAQPREFSVWSDTMFGGMPYVSGYGSPTPDLPGFRLLEKPFKALGYFDASMVLIGLICFYILMCIMGVNWWLAIAGSIAFAFASYNIIIIEAGHITKAYVIAYMPLTLAGMALLFKKRYLWGGILFLLGVALSIANGHLQITYYLMILCFLIYLGYLIIKIKEKAFKEVGMVTAILVGCVLISILPNTKNLYLHWDLGEHSMRGPTELTTVSSEGEKISTGLDKEYAFQWSYGRTELLTLLIPNAYGGSSVGTLDSNSEFYKTYRSLGAQLGSEIQAPTYWGDKISTSGPVYFGAIVCFLFVVGMFVIRSPLRWWLLAGAILLTFLALGRHLAWFNDFIFHYLPFYNKFRTPEMALVIPGLVFPIIAIWGLKVIFSGHTDEKLMKKAMIWGLSITGGLSLLVWILPDLFLDFRSRYDAYYQLPESLYSALIADRQSLASSDAFRSLIFILLGAGLLFWYTKAKNKVQTATIVSAAIAVLTLVDLWSVDKRYLNEKNFVRGSFTDTYQPSVADKEILRDTDLSYRVLNLNNSFQETNTSYYHKSIGGYHAAKLRKYQELIDHRLFLEINTIIKALQEAQTPQDLYNTLAASTSLNMLNTRYIIYNPDQSPLRNPFAFGNAWFVDNIEIVENADAEIQALNSINPLTTAIVDKRFVNYLEGFTPQQDSTAIIRMEDYRPNKLTYSYNANTEQLTVFSEIYYQPGWRAFIDGQPVDHIRADWTLRAMRIPAGKHEIIFEFYPENYVKAAFVETYSSFLILLLLIVGILYSGWKYIRQDKESIKVE